jgi:hypothetical protein
MGYNLAILNGLRTGQLNCHDIIYSRWSSKFRLFRKNLGSQGITGMKRLLAGIFLLLFVTACNSTHLMHPPDIVTSQPEIDTNSVQTKIYPTASPTLLFSTESPTPISRPTSIPCISSDNYCIEMGHFLLDRPIALAGVNTIDRGYPYGSTELGTRDPHHGVEFNNASGTPVLASADGRVLIAGDDSHTIIGPRLNFYGNIVVLEHSFPSIPEPVFTVYGHLSKVNVQPGQIVREGDKIGEVGASGEAIGSHLHFEVRVGQDDYDSNRNPELWLKPLSGPDGVPSGTLAGRLVDAKGKTLYTSNLNIQFFPDTSKPQAAAYQVETYAPEKQHPVGQDDLWNENFSLGDVPAGNYRLSLVWAGKLFDRWVIVMPGKLTYTTFQIDQ